MVIPDNQTKANAYTGFIYLITPTHKSPTRMAGLTMVSNSLALVNLIKKMNNWTIRFTNHRTIQASQFDTIMANYRIKWILIEDDAMPDKQVHKVLNGYRSYFDYYYFSAKGTPNEAVGWIKKFRLWNKNEPCGSITIIDYFRSYTKKRRPEILLQIVPWGPKWHQSNQRSINE